KRESRRAITASGCPLSRGRTGKIQFTAIAKLPPLRAIGARDEAQHFLAVIVVDHRGQKTARGVMGAGPEFAEGPLDALGLQLHELERQRLALGGDVEQTLAAVLLA